MTVYSYRWLVILMLLFFISPVYLCAQNKIDSLKTALPPLRDSGRIDCLNALSEAYRNSRVFDSARQFALQSAEESRKLNYVQGRGTAFYNLGTVEYELNDFTGAENASRLSIGIFEKIQNHILLAKSYVSYGKAIWAQSRFDEANVAFNKATELFTREADSSDLGATYGLMALEEEERGNYEKSFEFAMKAQSLNYENAAVALGQLYADVGDYETALDYYAKVTNNNVNLFKYLKVGEAFYLQKKYDSAIYYYQSYIRETGGRSKKLLSKPYALLGTLYLETKQYDTALVYLRAALKDFHEVNDRNWEMRVLLELGRTYRETGDDKTAIDLTRKLLSSAEETGARQYIRDAQYLLYELYDHLQKKDSAYKYLREYTALNHSIDIDISARKLAFYKTLREREQARLKIDLLNKEKELQQEELNRSAQQRKFLFIGISAIFLIGIVGFRNIYLKKRNEEQLREIAENDLHIQKLETKKQLGELEMQVLRTQMSPHFIFNSLNSINRFILQNNKFQASEYLTKFSRLVRMILENSQDKLVTLETELESLELYLSLEALRFDDHFSYKIVVHEEVDTTALKIPPLIIQPYAENAVWHGLMNKEEKGNLMIEIMVQDGFLLIKITDDGIGREKAGKLASESAAQHRSMGLGITSQRIAMVQASDAKEPAVVITDLVEPDGNPCGTEVVIKLPLIS